MPDYEDEMRLLILLFAGLIVLFLLASALEVERFWRPIVFSIALVLLAALILARFGGNLGRTV